MAYKTDQSIKTFSTALSKIADNVMITDPQGGIEYVNPAFEATTGYSSQEAVGQTPRILRSGKHTESYYKELWKTVLSGRVFRAITTNKKKNGDLYYADQTISPVQDDDGEIIHFVSVWKDITDRIAAEEKFKHLYDQLNSEKKKLEQVLSIEEGLHGIFEMNKLIDFVVEKTCAVLEAEKCSVMFIDQETQELCIKSHRGIEDSRMVEKNLKIGDPIEHLFKRHRKKEKDHDIQVGNSGSPKINGTIYQSETFLSVPIELKDHLLGIINVSDKKGKESNCFNELDLKILFMIVRQVSIAIENTRLYRELKYLSMTDPLTGIYNARHFIRILDFEIARARRYERGLSFLMIGIDQFKTYNDAFGQVEGDKLLKAISRIIKQNARETDLICRYTGDEFAVILPETRLEQARVAAERIREKISSMSAKRSITVSIGAAQCSTHTDRHDLIQRADHHLIAAKKQGKNQVAG